MIGLFDRSAYLSQNDFTLLDQRATVTRFVNLPNQSYHILHALHSYWRSIKRAVAWTAGGQVSQMPCGWRGVRRVRVETR